MTARSSLFGLINRFDTGQDVPVYRTALAVVGGVAAGSMMLNLVLGATIAVLVPNRQVELRLVTFSPAKDAVVEISTLTQRSPAWPKAEEAWVRQYIQVREGVLPDRELMTQRTQPPSPNGGHPGGWLARRSTKQVYDAWKLRHEAFIRAALERGITRMIEIEDPVERPAGPGSSVYTVTFRTTDTEQGVSAPSRRWRVTLRVGYAGQVKRQAEELVQSDLVDEIFGFTVLSYEIAEISRGT